MKNLKHVKLFEQFNQEGGMDTNPLANRGESMDPTSYQIITNLEPTGSFPRPEYVAKSGDRVAWIRADFSAFGLLNNDELHARIEDSFRSSDMPDFSEIEGYNTITTINLKPGDSYVAIGMDAKPMCLTQQELVKLASESEITVGSSKGNYNNVQNEIQYIVFAILPNPNQIIGFEDHGRFYLSDYSVAPAY